MVKVEWRMWRTRCHCSISKVKSIVTDWSTFEFVDVLLHCHVVKMSLSGSDLVL